MFLCTLCWRHILLWESAQNKPQAPPGSFWYSGSGTCLAPVKSSGRSSFKPLKSYTQRRSMEVYSAFTAHKSLCTKRNSWPFCGVFHNSLYYPHQSICQAFWYSAEYWLERFQVLYCRTSAPTWDPRNSSAEFRKKKMTCFHKRKREINILCHLPNFNIIIPSQALSK